MVGSFAGILQLPLTRCSPGNRRGKQVVQVYAERPGSAVERPVRWLVASAPVRADAGETAGVTVNVPTRLLAYWDNGWQHEPGGYRLRIGTSVTNLPLETTIELTGAAG